jgi:acetyl/propionyl-CoA carboxylase alpha subunit
MIAKVIATAEDRGRAIARLAAALRAFPILGLQTNIPFLLRVLAHPRFVEGTMDTAFLDREGAAVAGSALEPPPHVRAAAAAAADPSRFPNPEAQTNPKSRVPNHGVTPDPWLTLKGWGR